MTISEKSTGGSTNRGTPATDGHESTGELLRRTIAPDAMRVDLVSAFAGDRAMTATEEALVEAQIEARGKVFYSDLFFTLSHQYFAPEVAEPLWRKVLQHKYQMSTMLQRNVRITVATLDYLSNVTTEMPSPTLISEAYAAEIANLSMRDGMTGLYNHSSCYELLALELKSHLRYGSGIAVIMMDIDDFKLVNDQYGHQEGDRILVELAKLLTAQVRDSDICCRLGGEEFVAILPFTSTPPVALEIAERIRKHTEKLRRGTQGITISAGVAVTDSDTRTTSDLMERADAALYHAKRQGKNRVVLGIAAINQNDG